MEVHPHQAERDFLVNHLIALNKTAFHVPLFLFLYRVPGKVFEQQQVVRFDLCRASMIHRINRRIE